MIPSRKILSPALALSHIKTDKFKTEMLSVSILAPVDRYRSPMSLLALSTLKRGTEKFPTIGAVNRRLDELYATTVSVKSLRQGNCNVLGFSAEMLGEEYTDGKTDIFGGTLELICQMLFHPLTDERGFFMPAYIENERNNQCDTIAAQINNPRAYASRRMRDILYEGDDYGISLVGEIDAVRAITGEQLRDCYHSLIRDNRFEVFYVGSRPMDEVEAMLSHELLPRLGDAPRMRIAQTPAPIPVREVRRVTEEMPLAQGKLVMGFDCGVHIRDEDFFAMLVMKELYGYSPVNKLFMQLREKMSLCYYCSASYDIFKGTMSVSSGIAPENRDIAECEIINQLHEIAAGHVTPEEFEAAKHSLLGGYRSIFDSPAALESYYSCREDFGIDCPISLCMEKIKEVELADVVRVAAGVRLDTVYFLNGNGEEGEDD